MTFLVLHFASKPIDDELELILIGMLTEMSGLQAVYLTGISFKLDLLRELAHKCVRISYVQVVEKVTMESTEDTGIAEDTEIMKNMAAIEPKYLLLHRKQKKPVIRLSHSDWFGVGVPDGIQIAEYKSFPSDTFDCPVEEWTKIDLSHVLMVVPNTVTLSHTAFENLSTLQDLLSGTFLQQVSFIGDGFEAVLSINDTRARSNKFQVKFTKSRYTKIIPKLMKDCAYSILIASNSEPMDLFDFADIENLVSIEIHNPPIYYSFLKSLSTRPNLQGCFEALQIISGTCDEFSTDLSTSDRISYVEHAARLENLKFVHFRDLAKKLGSCPGRPGCVEVEANEDACYKALGQQSPLLKTGVCMKIIRLASSPAELAEKEEEFDAGNADSVDTNEEKEQDGEKETLGNLVEPKKSDRPITWFLT